MANSDKKSSPADCRLRAEADDRSGLSHGIMRGRRFLVTAGPTVEAIDPVRFISNHSTGKMGYAIAEELAARGADVVLVSGPTCLPAPGDVRLVDVVSAHDMWRECTALWPSMDGAVMCAAVADYTPARPADTKLKKSGEEGISIELVPTRDIAADLGCMKRPGQILVGFALETDNEQANALSKMERKNLDIIVLNSLRDEGAGFGCDTNRITIFVRPKTCGKPDEGGTAHVAKTDFPLLSKRDAAARIVDHLSRAVSACTIAATQTTGASDTAWPPDTAGAADRSGSEPDDQN